MSGFYHYALALCIGALPTLLVTDGNIYVSRSYVAIIELLLVVLICGALKYQRYPLRSVLAFNLCGLSFIGLVAVTYLSSIWVGESYFSKDVDVSLYQRPSQLLMHLVTAVAIYHFIKCFDNSSDVIFIGVLFSATIILVRIIAQYYIDDCFQTTCSAWLAAPPIHANIRHISEQFMFFACVSTIYFWRNYIEATNVRAIAALLLSASCIALLTWTGGRGAILALVIAILVFLLANMKRLRGAPLVSVCWVGVSAIFVLIAEVFATLPWLGVSREIQTIASGVSLTELSVNRFDIWVDSFNVYLTSFWLGFGGGAYDHIGTLTHGNHSHNIFLEVLLEAGFVGFCFCVLGFVSLFFMSWSELKQASTNLQLAYFALLGLFINGLTGAVFTNGISLYYFAVCCSILLHEKYREQ